MRTVKRILLAAVVLMLHASSATIVNAQITQDWVAQYSGMRGAAVVADANGNIYVAGTSLPDAAHNFKSDIVVLKYDLAGNLVWAREFDPASDGFTQIANSVALDPAGNIIVGGRDFGNGFTTLKYDPNGNLLWQRNHVGLFEAVRVATDGAGNVYVTGPSSSSASARNYVTIKYDPNGNELWAKTYDGPNNFDDNPKSLVVTAAGDVAVTGESTGGVTSFDVATILYDTNGNERWVQRYNDAANGQDSGADVAFGPGGEVYAGGYVFNGNNTDFVLIKYDAAGNQVWVKTYNGPPDKGDAIKRVRVDSQGNIIVTGYEQQANLYSDFATIKYDAAGNQLWLQRFNLTSAGDEIPWNMAIGADNAVYLTGESANQVATVKYDGNGAPQWSMTFDNPTSLVDRGYGIALDAANNVVVTGQDPIQTIHYLQSSIPCDVAADFSASSTSGCTPQIVNFTDLSTGPVTSWAWNFGDGGTSTLQNPSHTYNAAGTYTVNLTVTSAVCNNTKTRTGYITINVAPTAAFFGSPTSGNAPLTVSFIDQSIGSPNSWSWNFGDGGASTLQNPSYQYTAPGTYTVSLTVTNACGSNTFTRSNYITVNAVCSNIALGKTATASSSSGSNTPNLAVDGNTTTFWRSSSGGTQYLQVDLGAVTLNYSQATIRWRGTRYAKSFQIRVSNTANFSTFTTVFNTTTGSGGNQTISLTGAPRTERYIRLHMTKVNSSYYAVNEFEVCGFSSSVLSKQDAEVTATIIPAEIAVHQNYPNPFNPSTSISFSLPDEMQVTLKVFNLIGEEVATLVNERRSAGAYTVVFDATHLPSGVYFYVMQAGEVRQVRRLVLMK